MQGLGRWVHNRVGYINIDSVLFYQYDKWIDHVHPQRSIWHSL